MANNKVKKKVSLRQAIIFGVVGVVLAVALSSATSLPSATKTC